MRSVRFRWKAFFIAWAVVYGFFVVPHWILKFGVGKRECTLGSRWTRTCSYLL